MNEKELAIQLAAEFNISKNNNDFNNDYFTFSTNGIPHFFDKYPNVNFELLQRELAEFGLTIKQGNNINCKSKYYQKEWNKFKTVFVFKASDENNL